MKFIITSLLLTNIGLNYKTADIRDYGGLRVRTKVYHQVGGDIWSFISQVEIYFSYEEECHGYGYHQECEKVRMISICWSQVSHL